MEKSTKVSDLQYNPRFFIISRFFFNLTLCSLFYFILELTLDERNANVNSLNEEFHLLREEKSLSEAYMEIVKTRPYAMLSGFDYNGSASIRPTTTTAAAAAAKETDGKTSEQEELDGLFSDMHDQVNEVNGNDANNNDKDKDKDKDKRERCLRVMTQER